MFIDHLLQTTNQVVLSPTSKDDCLNSLVSNVNNVDILDKEFELSDFVYVTPKQPSSGVKGRLKDNNVIAFWEQIKTSSWVLRVIREGYALAFVETPEKRVHKNHRYAVICEDFVKSEVTNLLQSGCIKEAIKEIRFWSCSFKECHGQKIWLSDPQPQILSYSDASHSGWGGYCVQIKGQVAMGTWTPDEANQSSTWRELRGTHMVLSSFAPQLQGKEVRHRTDNKNVESVLQIGSSSKLIHDEVLAIFKLCRKWAI